MKDAFEPSTDPSRRDVIKARFSRESDHIASLLVQAWPERIPALIPRLESLTGIEVHQKDEKGQLIVTVEAGSDRKLLNAISDIEQTVGVITVSLVYHQIEGGENEQ